VGGAPVHPGLDGGAPLKLPGVQVGAAVLVGEIADDGVALPEAERAVVDHRHDAHRIDGAECRIAGRPEAPAPVLALVGKPALAQHPEDLPYVDGVGASVDLEHRVSPGKVAQEAGGSSPAPAPTGAAAGLQPQSTRSGQGYSHASRGLWPRPERLRGESGAGCSPRKTQFRKLIATIKINQYPI